MTVYKPTSEQSVNMAEGVEEIVEIMKRREFSLGETIRVCTAVISLGFATIATPARDGYGEAIEFYKTISGELMRFLYTQELPDDGVSRETDRGLH